MLGEKISRKRWALLTTIIMLITSVLPTGVFAADSSTGDYQYQYIGTDTWGHDAKYTTKNNWGSTKTEETGTVLFKLQKKNSSKVDYAYCCDLETGAVQWTYYERTNLENSGYFDSETAKEIRNIVEHSYPWVSASEVQNNVKAWLNSTNSNSRLNGSLSNKDLITATQISIWSNANESLKPIYCADNNAKNNVQIVTDYLLSLPERAAQETEIVVKDIDVTAEIFKEYGTGKATLSGTFAFYSNSSGARQKATPTAEDLTFNIKIGKKTIVSGKLKDMLNDGTVAFNEETSDYSYVVKDVDLGKSSGNVDVNITSAGTQKLPPNAYFYKTEKRNESQNFVGIAEWSNTFSVSETASAAITEEPAPEVTSISVKKAWADKNDQDGIRPDSIKVQLLADGKAFGEPVVLNEETGWAYTWENLLKYNEDNAQIEYTVKELNAPAGYMPEITGSAIKGYIITNNYIPATTTMTVAKVWDDVSDQDGIRPGSIKVQLFANGEAEGEAVTLNADNQWTYTWKNLPKNNAGKAIKYTVDETVVPEGYTKEISSNGNNTVIINHHTPAVTSVKVAKTWDDNNDQDGIRPESVKVQLLADGKAFGSEVILSAADNWTHTWKDLPKNNAGKAIKYTVDEVSLSAGYTKEITGSSKEGYIIKNTHVPETIDVEVEKLWEDLNDIEGLRSDEVMITLKADGKEVSSIPVNKLNQWNDAWEELPKYDKGKEIEYSITVEGVPEGYETEDITTSITEGGKLKFTVKSKYVPKTSVAVSKAWEDANNQDGIRPESVQILLFADGEALGDPIMLNEETGWTYKWENLNKYGEGNAQVEYTVKELNVPAGYNAKIIGNAKSGYTVTNTHLPEKSKVSVDIVWNDAENQDGVRPDSIAIQLLANGKAFGETVVVDTNDGWTHEWENLDKYDDGEEIIYTVKEPEDTSDYKYAVTGDAETGYTVTGTHEPETIDVEVKKQWEDLNDVEGLRSDEVRIKLKAADKEVGSITVNKSNDWNDTWKDLPKYEKGKEIDYTITVDGVPEGYETEGIDIQKTKDGKIKFTVKSKYVPKTSVDVTKVWEDADDQDGLRPESVQIQLLADGEDLGAPIVLDEKTGWTYKWDDLNKYGEGNAPVEYTVKELNVPAGYTAATTGSVAEGYTITNTHTPEEIDITVLKKWNDNNDQDGLRPDNVKIQLYGDNKKVGKPLKLSNTNEWNEELSDLPKNEDGEEIDYTIDVKGVPRVYSTEITEISDEEITDFVVASTYVSETKTGDDSNMILWAMMLLTSLLIMILIFATGRRRIQH